ncbi:uncharacterized protein EAE98_011684 [Botrytis deweyae]|uniref:SLC26A/SulP transporter domain-containing protein n=1 Tax=Botrytis deweyae TaxID=2478750 RepID=A0ABQ7I5A9_9HELO|nr:uncharacterized protein EAE98_011684 [Botrytis deweyae]KAF7913134.1 hypothetical protein EAE98_011684 [Botrytis deweyae]
MDAGRIVFIIISGILVTKFGHYMPYMAVGTIITVIAADLLTMFGLDTSTARSTAFIEEDLSIGNGLTVFDLQLGTSLAFAISQPVFLAKIFSHLANDPLTSTIPRSSIIIAAGASHLNRLVDNSTALEVLRKAYSERIRDTMIVALVASCLCLLCLPGMEWLTLENTGAKIKTDIENPASGVLSLVENDKDS